MRKFLISFLTIVILTLMFHLSIYTKNNNNFSDKSQYAAIPPVKLPPVPPKD